jgi:hypothetical protein
MSSLMHFLKNAWSGWEELEGGCGWEDLPGEQSVGLQSSVHTATCGKVVGKWKRHFEVYEFRGHSEEVQVMFFEEEEGEAD